MENKTTYIDRDGNLSVEGTFGFEGSLGKLKKIIDAVIEEHGEETKCKIALFGKFPNIWTPHIIINNENK
jgi:hypothetical protein